MIAPPEDRSVLLGREQVVSELVAHQAGLFALREQYLELAPVLLIGYINEVLAAGRDNSV
jgi:hypothetical protein